MDAIPSQTQRHRLNEISKCVEYINECDEQTQIAQDWNSWVNWMWGLLDWSEELHRLLYEYDKEIDELSA